ncbi:MAG TPA: universal stress protein [Candidatus Dormibacteraeota bacterium]|nr:universal stress protein [Candidatus Dormibacteraeota bacterium]
MSSMTAISNNAQLKQILYLTDFSQPSEAALTFALGIARLHGSTVHALHVITAPLESYPESLRADREISEAEMRRVEAHMQGVIHDTSVTEATDLWSGFERAIAHHGIDLVVVGTHGRTGAERLLLGSAAEEIFRRSPIPVMTVGPDVKHEPAGDGALDRILFATDFSASATAALPFAIALAKENHSRLLLLHVLPKRREPGNAHSNKQELSVAEAFHQLHEMLPAGVPLPQPPDFAVEFGRPADAILAAAGQRGACVIILGIRSAEGHLGAATHFDRPTAHKVVAHARCPVLTVRA